MITQETERKVLTAVIQSLQNDIDLAEEQKQQNILVVNKLKQYCAKLPQKSKPARRFLDSKTFSVEFLQRMCEKGVYTITPQWVIEQFECNYNTAIKKIQRAVNINLLQREGEKGVYSMTTTLKQEIEIMMKKSPDTIDVQKLVGLLMSFGKYLKDKAEKEIPTQSATKAIRDMLQHSTRPLHGIKDIHKALRQQGHTIHSSSVQKICANMPDVVRVAANTWIAKPLALDTAQMPVLPAN